MYMVSGKVFIAHMAEHCSINTEAVGLNHIEV